MELIGETIRHQQFGKGVVTACDHNIITVDFPSGVKRFVYPDAFEAFLIPKDSETKDQIDTLLEQQKRQEQERERAELAYQKKIAHLRAMKIPANGQIVFDLDNQEDNNPFETGVCTTGVYLSGFSKGEHRAPQRVNFNSMCILTKREEGQPESSRKILAVAMAPEDFNGAACEDGQVPFHPQFRLKLRKPLTLWKYMGKEPQKAWGRTTFKYVSNKIGEEILYDVRRQMNETESESTARSFYQYYCDCNHLIVR